MSWSVLHIIELIYLDEQGVGSVQEQYYLDELGNKPRAGCLIQELGVRSKSWVFDPRAVLFG